MQARRTIPPSYSPRHPSRQLLEIASWRVVAEMVRRYPQARLIQTNPGNGQTDCLTLFPKEGRHPFERLDFNRLGGLTYHYLRPDGSQTFKVWPDFWAEFFNAADTREPMRKLAMFASLPPVAQLKTPTPAILAYRFIAGFLTHVAFNASFGSFNWECQNGYLDTSDGFGGVWESRFAEFPAAAERMREPSMDDPFGVPAYRFWFILLNEDPQLCLETTGRIWDRQGNEHSLEKLLPHDQRIWPVIAEVAADLLS
jgi:hypothetical protein